MKKIWAYGCSWTKQEQSEHFIKFWPEIVANELNYSFKNNGLGGGSNFESRNRLISDLSKIKEGDIVIYQFTFPSRFYINYLDGFYYEFKWYFNNDSFKMSKYYNKKDYEIWLNFILNFETELLLNDFYNIAPLFDYIENKGVIVKYWFITEIPKEQQKKIFNYKRTVTVNSILNIGFFIGNNKFTLENDFKNGIIKDEKFKNDKHPNQEGHNFFAKNIVYSIERNHKNFNFQKNKYL